MYDTEYDTLRSMDTWMDTHDTKYVTEYDTTHAHSVTGCIQGVLSVTEVLHVGSTTPRVLYDARDVCSDVCM